MREELNRILVHHTASPWESSGTPTAIFHDPEQAKATSRDEDHSPPSHPRPVRRAAAVTK